MASPSLPEASTKPTLPPPPPAVTQWAEEDEEKLLRAALDFVMEPVESFDPTVSPFLRMERALAGRGFTREEILAKIKELRRRYEDGGSGASGAVFDISNKIWGRACGEEKKDGSGCSARERVEETKDRQESKEKQNRSSSSSKKKRKKSKPLRDFYDA